MQALIGTIGWLSIAGGVILVFAFWPSYSYSDKVPEFIASGQRITALMAFLIGVIEGLLLIAFSQMYGKIERLEKHLITNLGDTFGPPQTQMTGIESSTSDPISPNQSNQGEKQDALPQRYLAIRKEYGTKLSHNGIVLKIMDETKLDEEVVKKAVHHLAYLSER